MTIKEILSVLDMTEADQYQWCYEQLPELRNYPLSLADLAFRMRDEAVKKNIYKYIDAENIVKSHLLIQTNGTINWSYDSQPIHWIIVSEIAKELAK